MKTPLLAYFEAGLRSRLASLVACAGMAFAVEPLRAGSAAPDDWYYHEGALAGSLRNDSPLPLYDDEDVVEAIGRFFSIPYRRSAQVAPGIRMLVVPGSQEVKAEAEAEGLDVIFKRAGAEWREAGCSMCIAMNGDQLEPGQYAVSTSNRNFEGRQGPGVRTVLASPLVAAATALAGHIADPREYLAPEAA